MTSRRDFVAMAAATASIARSQERSGRHYFYEFSGTPYEVGLQHGKILKLEIRHEAQPAVDRLRSGVDGFLARYEGIWRERMPHVIEEIHGIADGAELGYSYAFFAATRDFTRAGACTAIACSRDKASRFMAQTKDTEAPLDRFRIMRIRYASGRRMVVLNYPGWIANLCLTSDGVSTTGNSLYAAAPEKATVPGSFLKRLIMEKRSTQEVLDAIRGMSFENGCIMVGDKSGHMVCMELAAGRVNIRDVSRQDFGHANNILTPGMQTFERTLQSPSSPLRQKNIDRILAAASGQICVQGLQAALRDHQGYPLSICRHPSPKDVNITNAAFVADLNALEMHIAIGNPCVAPFVRYKVMEDAAP